MSNSKTSLVTHGYIFVGIISSNITVISSLGDTFVGILSVVSGQSSPRKVPGSLSIPFAELFVGVSSTTADAWFCKAGSISAFVFASLISLCASSAEGYFPTLLVALSTPVFTSSAVPGFFLKVFATFFSTPCNLSRVNFICSSAGKALLFSLTFFAS